MLVCSVGLPVDDGVRPVRLVGRETNNESQVRVPACHWNGLDWSRSPRRKCNVCIMRIELGRSRWLPHRVADESHVAGSVVSPLARRSRGGDGAGSTVIRRWSKSSTPRIPDAAASREIIHLSRPPSAAPPLLQRSELTAAAACSALPSGRVLCRISDGRTSIGTAGGDA